MVDAISVFIRKDLSDREQQQLALSNALSLGMESAILALITLGFFLLVLLPALLIDHLLGPSPSTLENLSTPLPLILIAVMSIIYAIARRRRQ